MKKNKIFLLGMAVILLTIGLVFTGCKEDSGDNNPFVGTWTGTINAGTNGSSSATLTIAETTYTISAPTFNMSENGTYTYEGSKATMKNQNGNEIGYATLSGGTLTVTVNSGESGTFTRK